MVGIDLYLPVPPTSKPQNLEAVSTPKALLELRFQHNSAVTGRTYRRNNWLRLEQRMYNTSGYASKSVCQGCKYKLSLWLKQGT